MLLLDNTVRHPYRTTKADTLEYFNTKQKLP